MSKRVRYYYDTEFLDDGKTIDLISIGIVCSDGREYYAVNCDAPWKAISHHSWLMSNVVPCKVIELMRETNRLGF